MTITPQLRRLSADEAVARLALTVSDGATGIALDALRGLARDRRPGTDALVRIGGRVYRTATIARVSLLRTVRQ